MARRADKTLRPLDYAILSAALALRARKVDEFHGYQLAREMQLDAIVVGHTTLYRALDAMELMGLVESRWEDKGEAAREGRPPRCYYKLTGLAEPAYRTWPRVQTVRGFAVRPNAVRANSGGM